MLLAISGFATWSGMNDFIVDVSTSPAAQRRDIGGLFVTNEMLVITIVIALTFLMWVCLRESFREAAPKSRKASERVGRGFRDRFIAFAAGCGDCELDYPGAS